MLEGYKSRGINVLILDDPVDSFWTSSTPSFKEKNIKSISEMKDKMGQEIEKDLERDNFMSSNEAKSYGLIDTVLSKRNEMK